jgi:pimeloyl-ACP methyl ester carboxylesterase
MLNETAFCITADRLLDFRDGSFATEWPSPGCHPLYSRRRPRLFYGGDGSFDTFSARTRDYIVATTPTNILDWSSAWCFDVPLAVYAGITAPSLLVRGERSHPAVQRVAEVLSDAVSGSSLVTVPGASHFMIATHASDVARLIREHVATIETLR